MRAIGLHAWSLAVEGVGQLDHIAPNQGQRGGGGKELTHLAIGLGHNVLGAAGNPGIPRGQNALQQRTDTFPAVIRRTGQGQVSEATEVGLGRREKIVQPSGLLQIEAALQRLIGVPEFGDPTVITQLNRGHWNGLQLMNGSELGKTVPVRRQQPLDARHIASRQVNVGFNHGLSLWGGHHHPRYP